MILNILSKIHLEKYFFMVNFKTSDTNSYIAFTAFSLSLDLHNSPAHFLEPLAIA